MKKPSPTPLASVIDLLLDAVCVVDLDGRFVFVSAACERIFGYTPEEMRGKAMIEMVVAEDVARTLAAANEVMSGQPKLHFANRYIPSMVMGSPSCANMPMRRCMRINPAAVRSP